MNIEKGNKKVINAWATYDLANSVYNLVITATIFPIYYKIVTTTKNPDGTESYLVPFAGQSINSTALYDFAIAFAYLLVAVAIPFLSGIADYGGSKKKFMMFFTWLGSFSCMMLYFFESHNLLWGISFAILACIGYSGSLVFYNAYLPEIASVEEQDSVSAKGFAMGYWGSALLLIISLILVQTRDSDAEKIKMMRYSFLMVGSWWFLFSLIPFIVLPNNVYNKKSSGNKFTKGYSELKLVWNELKHQKKLTRFLFAFFVYSMGVQTVLLVANHFGAIEIKMESGQLITTILILQFLAMAGAYLFSWLSKIKGNIFTLKLSVIVWALICLCTFLFVYNYKQFYIVAALVGLVMGGIQSLSRSTYSKMLPETQDHSSYFSFYDVCEKTSIVLGMASFGAITNFSNTMRTPIIALISFFVLGFILLLRIPKSTDKQ